MRFRTLLYAGFGILVIIMVLVLTIVMNMLSNQNEQMNMLVKDRYEKIRLANQIRTEVGKIAREVNEVAYAHLDSLEIQNIQAIEKAYPVISNNLGILEGELELTNAKTSLFQVKERYQKYKEQVDTIILFNMEDGKVELRELLTNAEDQRKDLVASLDELVSIQEQAMAETMKSSTQTYNHALRIAIFAIICATLLGAFMAFIVIRTITRRLNKVKNVMKTIQYGSGQFPRIDVAYNDEVGAISVAYNEMALALEKHEKAEKASKLLMEEQNWLKTKASEIFALSQGMLDINELGRQYIRMISKTVGANYGLLYLKQGQKSEEHLIRWASYAFSSDNAAGAEKIELGEGLVGQCAIDNQAILVEQIPECYIKISSGLGETNPSSIFIVPVSFEGEVLAIIELATLSSFSSVHQSLIEQVASQLGISLNRINKHLQVQELLEESQTLNEELQTQSEELQMQQEELQTMNDELEAQYKNAELRATELEQIKNELESKNREVMLGSKYKSEFLANMSHELRTPLNSLLILAQMLYENKEGNLDQKQIEYASTIYAAGNDLLRLINEILDLSKIESGKIEAHPCEVVLNDVASFVERQFLPLAKKKNIQFSVNKQSNVPEVFITDEHRLQQILNNLLSNAFKFTEKGSIQLQIGRKKDKLVPRDGASIEYLTFSVTDTGVGIPRDKHSIVFEAFRQADGTTSRKHGGTGLGLSISKELAQLLNGYIHLESTVGKGSTFTLFLPITGHQSVLEAAASVELHKDEVQNPIGLSEDLLNLNQKIEMSQHEDVDIFRGNKILVVDDDMRNIFALTSALESADMKVVFAENGKEALQMLEDHPDIDLVLMDIMMPEMDGFEAISKIRQLPEYRLLPIIALTAKAMKNDRQKCIDVGATDYISKPVNLEQLFTLLRVWLQ